VPDLVGRPMSHEVRHFGSRFLQPPYVGVNWNHYVHLKPISQEKSDRKLCQLYEVVQSLISLCTGVAWSRQDRSDTHIGSPPPTTAAYRATLQTTR